MVHRWIDVVWSNSNRLSTHLRWFPSRVLENRLNRLRIGLYLYSLLIWLCLPLWHSALSSYLLRLRTHDPVNIEVDMPTLPFPDLTLWCLHRFLLLSLPWLAPAIIGCFVPLIGILGGWHLAAPLATFARAWYGHGRRLLADQGLDLGDASRQETFDALHYGGGFVIRDFRIGGLLCVTHVVSRCHGTASATVPGTTYFPGVAQRWWGYRELMSIGLAVQATKGFFICRRSYHITSSIIILAKKSTGNMPLQKPRRSLRISNLSPGWDRRLATPPCTW